MSDCDAARGGSGTLRRMRTLRARIAFCVAAAALATLGAIAPGGEATRARAASLPRFPSISPLCHRTDFESQGRTVRAALCRPAGGATMPAAIVLHGCGGMGGIDGVLARDLPAHGVAAYYIDYFGLTPAPSKRGFCGAGDAIGQAFPVWQQIVVDATRALARIPGIDPSRIGAVGWSMGGGLALLAAQYGAGSTPLRRSPFRALVVLSTFDESSNARALPPTLVLSGGRHDIVPASEAVALYHTLKQAHVPAELHVYPNGNHNWKGRQRIAGERWTFSFLRRYLVR